MYEFNKKIGNYGENVAEYHLREKGYKILDKNFRCKLGEIDIIAQKDSYIVFVEVKSRYGTIYGNPIEAVTYSKKYKIYKTALAYIQKRNLLNFDFRFDIIEILLNLNDNSHFVNHITDAFQVYK
ncbi:YraN family protein [Clostridium hydrogenum]|uniref:YraN family protein n=1 Tax=Clostridium hydrogenum TaxID=2855764 RepID=UPI001F213B1C|nr:YraN family protein [Clostridium hydrogenum]